ncbi:MAG: glycosyltransferase family 4 protein [Bauldia sp.]|nr:glycosyltransferase family 4 protein [Bauldia sp.]
MPATEAAREIAVARPAPASGIAAYGFFSAPIGIGEAGRRGVDALRTAGVPVAAHTVDLKHIPLKVPYPADEPGAPDYDTALLNLNPSGWLRDAAKGLRQTRKVAVWHWELPVFPPLWMRDVPLVTEVWAPSQFIADPIKVATNLPVRVVPHPALPVPVDRTLARDRLGLPQTRRIILTAFDFRSLPERKNPVGTLKAFHDAFPSEGDTPLLLVKYHRHDDAKDMEYLDQIKATPNVHVIDRSVTQEEMRDIYAASDAFISLHRSEGFGLNLLDMMALGRVCIATGFSGNLDFMTSDNSLLIPWSMRAVRPGDYPFGEGQWWAEPDHDAAVEALRFVGAASESALAAIADRAAADTARTNSLERVGALARAAWLGEPPPPLAGEKA